MLASFLKMVICYYFYRFFSFVLFMFDIIYQDAREGLLSRSGSKSMLSAESNPTSPSFSSPKTPKVENLEDSFLSSSVPLR